MKIDEGTYETIKRASDITLTDYDIRWFDAENIDGYIENDNLISIIEDLICQVDYLEEQIEDIKQDIEDNYRPVPIAEQVGISDKDFI